MPPKRKQPPAPRAPAKRRSKFAKENDITAEQEAEILDAFELFASKDSASQPVIATGDVRRCLVALNAPPQSSDQLRELLEAADPDEEGWVSYEHFVAVAALMVNARAEEDPEAGNEEVVRAYQLFTRGEERPITLADLRRVAKDIREDVPETVLKDMVSEATGGGLGGVSMEDFEGVMRRAGVFS